MEYIKQNFADGQTLKADHLNHIEDGIYNLATNSDNGGASDCDWNIMKNKPFYDETKDYGSTITWDGNTEGLLATDEWEDPYEDGSYDFGGMYLVSESIPDVVNEKITLKRFDGSNGEEYLIDDYGLVRVGNIISDSSWNVQIVLEDNAEFEDVVFPKKGVWFRREGYTDVNEEENSFASYTSSITLHEGSFVENKFKKLDPKFIPNTKTIFYTKHDDEFLYTDSECTVMAVRDDVIKAFEKGKIYVKDNPRLYRIIYMEDTKEYVADDQSGFVKVTIAKERDSALIPLHFYTAEYFGTPV